MIGNEMNFSGSYAAEDVRILLKQAAVEFTDVAEKERRIQSGEMHYSQMLSPETVPGTEYMKLYEHALARNAARLHGDVIRLADMMVDHVGKTVTLVSLARAGTPIGVLLQRHLRRTGIDSRHYSVSIIRDRGLDMNAMKTIVAERGARNIIFVDGWTGKGAIAEELRRTLGGGEIAPRLAVIADPAGRANMAATLDDYVIPSGILNGIVSGLISRSVLNEDVVGEGEYHACLNQTHLAEHDRTMEFIHHVESAVPQMVGHEWKASKTVNARRESTKVVRQIMARHGLNDVNRVKPGIAEATRAVLRRVPEAVYLKNVEDVDTGHIVHLAKQAGIEIHQLTEDCPYRAVTVIRTLGE